MPAPISEHGIVMVPSDIRKGPGIRFGSKADICSARRHVCLPPKADMCGAVANVCFGPIADIQSLLISPWQLTDLHRSAILVVRISRQHCLCMINVVCSDADVPSEVGC